jgi:hypothetical protein
LINDLKKLWPEKRSGLQGNASGCRFPLQALAFLYPFVNAHAMASEMAQRSPFARFSDSIPWRPFIHENSFKGI